MIATLSAGVDRFRLPPFMGHRGATAAAPENTIAGFRAAAGQGAPWVEFDVGLTADRRCVVFHDDTLKRTTGVRGRIDTSTLATVSALDAGAWFSSAFAGEPVPTLEAALEAIAGLGMGANIELKHCLGREAALVEAVSAIVARHWPASAPPAMISSFDDNILRIAKQVAPDISRGFIVERLPRAWRRIADAVGCVSIHGHQRHLTAAGIGRVKEAGLLMAAWSTDDADRALTLWDWGVDCVLTGAPAVIDSAWKSRQSNTKRKR